MKFTIELQCQNCGGVEHEDRTYDQVLPMVIKTHKCYPLEPLRLGVMLPKLIVKVNDEPETA